MICFEAWSYAYYQGQMLWNSPQIALDLIKVAVTLDKLLINKIIE